MIFKNMKDEYSLFIRILITIGVSIASLAIFYPILKYIEDISVGTSINVYIPVLIKALGISLMIQITSDICKDCGEISLGHRVELFGKAEILLLSIPLIKDLFDLCDKLAG
jgi:stage III sporulation protein AD